jgi:hypothetical protein
MEEEKDQFAGLSAAQKKKLKAKLKAEKEAAGTDQPEAGRHLPPQRPYQRKTKTTRTINSLVSRKPKRKSSRLN